MPRCATDWPRRVSAEAALDGPLPPVLAAARAALEHVHYREEQKAPPPLEGGGWGEGSVGGSHRPTPPPNPLPQGEGEPALPETALATDPSLLRTLTDALADPAPHRLEDGNVIRPGFDGELDAERSLRDDSRRVLTTMQLDCAQRYGVASLKIKHHAQLGYVIEVQAANVEKLRGFPELTLRQGMANGARFTTPELSELDRRISEAGERAAARERAVFAHLVRSALGARRRTRRLR